MVEKVFITGASGFIGQYVTRGLAELGLEVNALLRDSYNRFTNYPNVTSSYIPLHNTEGLISLLKNFKPDVVIHLAAIASPTHGNVSEIYYTNVCGTESLLDAISIACPVGTKVVLTSTAGVYGNSHFDLIPEFAEYSPVNHYSFSKMSMELLSRTYEENLDIKIVRPFNIIGNGQKGNFLVPKLVRSFYKREKIIKVGNINTIRDYSDILFASRAFIDIALNDWSANVYNICSGHGTSGLELIYFLKELTGFEPIIEVNNLLVRKKEIDRSVGDPSLLKKFIKNQYKNSSVKKILSDMLESFSDQGVITQ